MFCVTLGSEYSSRIRANVFQMQEDLDRAILTVETKCDLGPPGNIYDLSTIQFHGNREELRKLAEVIFNAAEQLKDPEEPAPSEYVAGDNHSALFEATDIEESLKYGG